VIGKQGRDIKPKASEYGEELAVTFIYDDKEDDEIVERLGRGVKKIKMQKCYDARKDRGKKDVEGRDRGSFLDSNIL
jgi:hypothetical protein